MKMASSTWCTLHKRPSVIDLWTEPTSAGRQHKTRLLSLSSERGVRLNFGQSGQQQKQVLSLVKLQKKKNPEQTPTTQLFGVLTLASQART